jgi:hypothetical protein
VVQQFNLILPEDALVVELALPFSLVVEQLADEKALVDCADSDADLYCQQRVPQRHHLEEDQR